MPASITILATGGRESSNLPTFGNYIHSLTRHHTKLSRGKRSFNFLGIKLERLHSARQMSVVIEKRNWGISALSTSKMLNFDFWQHKQCATQRVKGGKQWQTDWPRLVSSWVLESQLQTVTSWAGSLSQEDVPPGPEDQSGVCGLGETSASHHLAKGWDRAQLLLGTRTRQ